MVNNTIIKEEVKLLDNIKVLKNASRTTMSRFLFVEELNIYDLDNIGIDRRRADLRVCNTQDCRAEENIILRDKSGKNTFRRED